HRDNRVLWLKVGAAAAGLEDQAAAQVGSFLARVGRCLVIAHDAVVIPVDGLDFCEGRDLGHVQDVTDPDCIRVKLHSGVAVDGEIAEWVGRYGSARTGDAHQCSNADKGSKKACSHFAAPSRRARASRAWSGLKFGLTLSAFSSSARPLSF